MMNRTLKLQVEHWLLFVVLPVSFILNYPSWLKLTLGVISGVFVFYHLIKNKAFVSAETIRPWRTFGKVILVRFLIIAILMFFYVYYFKRESLFNVLLNKPELWLLILFVYSFISVTLQELVYRTFYFYRYESLFSNKRLFLFINAFVFALAHSFLKNWLILLFTFVGGLLFAITYFKTRSTILVCIEHALYGFWLFTVGIGQELAFPEV